MHIKMIEYFKNVWVFQYSDYDVACKYLFMEINLLHIFKNSMNNIYDSKFVVG